METTGEQKKELPKIKSHQWNELGALYLDKAEKLQRLQSQEVALTVQDILVAKMVEIDPSSLLTTDLATSLAQTIVSMADVEQDTQVRDSIRSQSDALFQHAIVCFTQALRCKYIESRQLAQEQKRKDTCTDPLLYAPIYRARIPCLLKLHQYHLALADAEQLRDLGARTEAQDYSVLAYCYEQLKWYSRSKQIYSILFVKTQDDQWARKALEMDLRFEKATADKEKFVGSHRNVNISVANRAKLQDFILKLGYKNDLRPVPYKAWTGDHMTRTVDLSSEQLTLLCEKLENLFMDQLDSLTHASWYQTEKKKEEKEAKTKDEKEKNVGLYVAESKVHGRGVFTREAIKRNTQFGIDTAFCFISGTLGRCGYCGNNKIKQQARVWCTKCNKVFYCSPQCLEAAKKEFHTGVCGVDFKAGCEQISDDLLSDSPLRNMMIFQLIGITRNSAHWPCSTRDLPVLAPLDDSPSLLITAEEKKQGKTAQLNLRPEYTLCQKILTHVGIAGHPFFDFAWYDQLCRVLHKYTSTPWEKCLMLMEGHLRFLNHSCEPNVSTRVIMGSPGQKPRMELVALRDINAGEELLHCYFPINLKGLKSKNKRKSKVPVPRKHSKPPKHVEIDSKLDSAHVEGLRALGCACTCS